MTRDCCFVNHDDSSFVGARHSPVKNAYTSHLPQEAEIQPSRDIFISCQQPGLRMDNCNPVSLAENLGDPVSSIIYYEVSMFGHCMF